MAPKAIERMVKGGVMDDAEWTIETLEGFESAAQRAALATMSDQARNDIVSSWTESVAWILANDKRSDVLAVAAAMSERM